MTAASLKANYPEFNNTSCSDALVTKKIALAELQVSESVWGDFYDTGVELLTCHLLAMSPDGSSMRLDPEMRAGAAGLGVTHYGREFDELRTAVCCGLGRIC